jgi:Cof subfamily protein (haloacid dehalogenase superfamily)
VERKMIFFDIDGTLLNREKKLPASTKQAVQSLKEAGHIVAIATGRGPFMFKDIRKELGIDSFVSYNGQYVEYEGKAIYKNPIRNDLIESLAELAVRNDHPIVFMGYETMKSSVEYHVYVEESISTLKVPHPEHDPFYFREQDIYQILLFCTSAEEGVYKEQFKNDLGFIRWHQVSSDVLPLGGSKARGIAKMIELLGVEMGDVYAFGDELNDLEMLRFVENSVAMGNAPDVVKKAARYVTKDVEEDGILHGLQMLELL